MTVLFDGDVHVHYGFIWLATADDPLPVGDSRAGQSNGLCGAAIPGALNMVTGLHTGSVPLRVEALAAAPPLDDAWEDVVEVPLFAPDREYMLSAFEEFHEVTLPQVGSLRARWSAQGMDAAREADNRLDGESALDAYLLQLWPAPPAPDVVLRQTARSAAYWHEVARNSPPPPSPEHVARQAAEQQRQLEVERQARDEQDLLDSWGGSLPNPRVLALGYGRPRELAQQDRLLLDLVGAMEEPALRQLTAWICRTSCRHAGLEDADWVAPTLAALERGAPLPPPFDNSASAWDRLSAHWAAGDDEASEVTYEVSYEIGEAAGRTPLAPEAAALDAVLSTDTDDPLRAAIDALVGAGCSFDDPQDWYDEVRRHLTG